MRKIIKGWALLKKTGKSREPQFFKLLRYNRILAGKKRSGLYTKPDRDADTPDAIRKRELPFFYCWYKYNTSAPAKLPINKNPSVNNWQSLVAAKSARERVTVDQYHSAALTPLRSSALGRMIFILIFRWMTESLGFGFIKRYIAYNAHPVFFVMP